MRTLKKTLCLVLALALCFSLASVAFASNLDDFSDAESVTYTEAVDVLVGIGVVEGDTSSDGNIINPQGDLTRAQAAKLITYLALGATAADAMKADSDPFTDVPKGNWAAGYIAYCANEGIINGNGDGTFRPSDNVTGYEFAKMVLCVLGYGKNSEYTGKGWSIAVAKDALPLGLFTEVTDAASNEAINRETAFQIEFNALTVTKVNYNKIIEDYQSAGTTVADAYNLSKNVTGVYDDLGNKAHNWKVGSTVVTDKYADDVVVATVAATDKANAVAKLMDATVTVYENGYNVGTEAAAAIVARAAAGETVTLTDNDNDGIADKAIVVVEYLAKVTNVTTAAATGITTVTYTAYQAGAVAADTGLTITSEDYDVSGLAKDDYVLLVPKHTAASTPDLDDLISFKTVEPATSGVTSYTSSTVTYGGATYGYAGAYNTTVFTVKGSYAFGANTYDFYLNSNGFVVGATTHTVAAEKLNYIYVTDIQGQAPSTTLFGSTTGSVKVSGYLLDGTAVVYDLAIKTATADGTGYVGGTAAQTIATGSKYFVVSGTNYKVETVATGDSNYNTLEGKVLSYTTNSDGEVTLSTTTSVTIAGVTYAATSAATSITTSAGSAAITLNGPATVYGTASTKYVTVDTAGTVTTVTGYANFPGTASTAKTYTKGTDATAIVYATAKGVVTDVLVIGTAPVVNTNTTVLIYKGTTHTAPDADGAVATYYEFVTTDGTAVEYQVSDASTPAAATDVYSVTITDGIITTLGFAATPVEVTAVDDDYIVAGGTVYYKTSDSTYFNASGAVVATWAADTVVVGDYVVVIPGTGAAANNIVNAIITTASASRN
jgi:hypothetical protein